MREVVIGETTGSKGEDDRQKRAVVFVYVPEDEKEAVISQVLRSFTTIIQLLSHERNLSLRAINQHISIFFQTYPNLPRQLSLLPPPSFLSHLPTSITLPYLELYICSMYFSFSSLPSTLFLSLLTCHSQTYKTHST